MKIKLAAKELIPTANLAEDDDSFYIDNQYNNTYFCISKKDGFASIKYPIDSSIDKHNMREMYIEKKESSLELFVRFVDKYKNERLWHIGDMDEKDEEKAQKWIREVNLFYKEIAAKREN
ncbi:MAG: hypothetical protein AABW50_03780 [Nanoarchaeota archaeon]